MAPAPLITLIAGPTASGKSRLALEMAERTGAVIVNADSQQLYADLRVLSARPSHDDVLRVPHHLYGVADAADAWSVGRWSRAVTTLLGDLKAQSRPAVIVGGTGLYFAALTDGLAEIPAVPVDIRNEVGTLFQVEGEALFRTRLSRVDPSLADRIEIGDQQRLVRAYAVYLATGRTLSDWRASTIPTLLPGTFDCLVVDPGRSQVYAQCDRRVTAMVEHGAIEEVRALMERGLDPALPVMKAVGVREFAAYLSGAVSRSQAIEAAQRATRNYAKRQSTWLRSRMVQWPRMTLDGYVSQGSNPV